MIGVWGLGFGVHRWQLTLFRAGVAPVWDLEFGIGVLGLGFWVLGVEFWGLGLGFRALGFGFWVLGLGFNFTV